MNSECLNLWYLCSSEFNEPRLAAVYRFTSNCFSYLADSGNNCAEDCVSIPNYRSLYWLQIINQTSSQQNSRDRINKSNQRTTETTLSELRILRISVISTQSVIFNIIHNCQNDALTRAMTIRQASMLECNRPHVSKAGKMPSSGSA